MFKRWIENNFNSNKTNFFEPKIKACIHVKGQSPTSLIELTKLSDLLFSSVDCQNSSHKMIDLYVLLLFLSCIGSTVHGQSLRIARGKVDPDDDIQLPSVQSECPTITTPLCDKYNARRPDFSHSCWCQCNQPSGNYTFFEPNYSCIRVSEARQQAGKTTVFLFLFAVLMIR